MITNILIGVGCFILGGLIGAGIAMYKIGGEVLKIAKIYKDVTGNDFIAWINDTHSKIKTSKMYEL